MSAEKSLDDRIKEFKTKLITFKANEETLVQEFFGLRREAGEQNNQKAVEKVWTDNMGGEPPFDPNDAPEQDPVAAHENWLAHQSKVARGYGGSKKSKKTGGSTIIPQPLNHKPHPPPLPVPALIPSPPGTPVVAVPAFASIRLGPTVLPPPSPNRAPPSIINTPPSGSPPIFIGGGSRKRTVTRSRKSGGACCGQRVGGAKKSKKSKKSKQSKQSKQSKRVTGGASCGQRF